MEETSGGVMVRVCARQQNMWLCSQKNYEEFVCVSLFTHSGTINSRCYQQCGHSKTEQCTINMEGRPDSWVFSHTQKERGRKGGARKEKVSSSN